MGHMHIIAECMTEQDVECLEHLTDIQCDDNPNGDGFTLSFHFRPNEYFSNTVLTKRYLIPNFLLEEEPVMESVKGCEIMWKPGKCLTHTEVKKTQRAKGGKKSGQIRTIIKKERVVRTEQHQV
jgi:nucleosome assembly protein 1-like 1